MIDLNSTIPIIAAPFSEMMRLLQLLVGGVFGIYVISLIYKIFMFKEINKKLKFITKEITEIKIKLNKKGKN